MQLSPDGRSAEILVVGGFSTAHILTQECNRGLQNDTAIAETLRRNEGQLRGWINLQTDQLSRTLLPIPGLSPANVAASVFAGCNSRRSAHNYELFAVYQMQVSCCLQKLEVQLGLPTSSGADAANGAAPGGDAGQNKNPEGASAGGMAGSSGGIGGGANSGTTPMTSASAASVSAGAAGRKSFSTLLRGDAATLQQSSTLQRQTGLFTPSADAAAPAAAPPPSPQEGVHSRGFFEENRSASEDIDVPEDSRAPLAQTGGVDLVSDIDDPEIPLVQERQTRPAAQRKSFKQPRRAQRQQSSLYEGLHSMQEDETSASFQTQMGFHSVFHQKLAEKRAREAAEDARRRGESPYNVSPGWGTREPGDPGPGDPGPGDEDAGVASDATAPKEQEQRAAEEAAAAAAAEQEAAAQRAATEVIAKAEEERALAIRHFQTGTVSRVQENVAFVERGSFVQVIQLGTVRADRVKILVYTPAAATQRFVKGWIDASVVCAPPGGVGGVPGAVSASSSAPAAISDGGGVDRIYGTYGGGVPSSAAGEVGGSGPYTIDVFPSLKFTRPLNFERWQHIHAKPAHRLQDPQFPHRVYMEPQAEAEIIQVYDTTIRSFYFVPAVSKN